MIIKCPKCGVVLDLPNEAAGCKVECGECGEKFTAFVKNGLRVIHEPSQLMVKRNPFSQAKKKLSAQEKLAIQIKNWDAVVEEMKMEWQEKLSEWGRRAMAYVDHLQTGGLLCQCNDTLDFLPRSGEVVYRKVSDVSLEESRGIRRTVSHRTSQRSVDWSDDWNGRKRRLGDSYEYDGESESKMNYQFQPIDSGNIYVTNQRLLFIGQQQQRNLVHDKILSFDYDWVQEYGSIEDDNENDTIEGSIKVRVENRQRAMRFSGGNFYEFALVMKVLRESDFRKFLLSGPREKVLSWLDKHNAFPNWMIPAKPEEPYYPPRPTLPPSLFSRLLGLLRTFFGSEFFMETGFDFISKIIFVLVIVGIVWVIRLVWIFLTH